MIGRNSNPQAEQANPLAATKVRVGKRTEIGYYRDNNEDRMFVAEDRMLYIVADGMGGQAAGEQASQMAVDVVTEQLKALPIELNDGAKIRKLLSQAVVAANDAILAQGVADPSVQNMGTTIVMAVLRGHRMYIAHVGDSRAYHMRNKAIEDVTTDHNLAQALYQANTISKEELQTHRFRHVLWKYLGSKEAGDGPDIKEVDVRPGDRLLLATDGVTGAVDDDSLLEEIFRHTDPQQCADELVQLSLDRGSKDNVTCVVLFVDEV